MFLQQYNSLMSNLLKKKCSLAKLREELEGRKGKLCFSCKGFGYLAHNCRNKREEEKRTVVPQNKFKVLRSRIMQCGVEGRMIRRAGVVEVECFKCGEKGHKYRECPLWVRKKKLVYPVKKKAQEKERKLKKAEGRETAHVAEL